MESNTMTDKINNEDDAQLSAEELEQVKGGAMYIKFDGVDGESKITNGPKAGYDVKAAKKV